MFDLERNYPNLYLPLFTEQMYMYFLGSVISHYHVWFSSIVTTMDHAGAMWVGVGHSKSPRADITE